MAEVICGVCNAQPKKYKCPTCLLPYCSTTCYKTHKPLHETATTSTPTSLQPQEQQPQSLPTALADPTQPIPRPPKPTFLTQPTHDFTPLPTSPALKALFTQHPTLLLSLQRIYALTLEPDPEAVRAETQKFYRRTRGGTRGARGRGGRGRGRGGRGAGRSGWGAGRPPRWTEMKGEADALKLLKGFRDGGEGEKEGVGVGEFVRLLREMFGDGKEDGTMEVG